MRSGNYLPGNMYATENALQRYVPAGRFGLLFTVVSARRLIITPGLSGGIISVNPRLQAVRTSSGAPMISRSLGNVMVSIAPASGASRSGDERVSSGVVSSSGRVTNSILFPSIIKR